jgi:hypothetical protein
VEKSRLGQPAASRTGVEMHRYLVELRITSDEADIDEENISRRIGIKSSQFLRKGDSNFDKVSACSVWQLDARTQSGGLEWDSLEDGLRSLVEKLLPAKKAINELQSSYNVTILCAHFNSSFGGGPTLSPSLLGMLADLGVELTLASYQSSESQK